MMELVARYPNSPDPIEPEPLERELEAELAQQLLRDQRPSGWEEEELLESVVFDEVRLEGTFPKTVVRIIFHAKSRPELPFGYREQHLV
jgi:hypothetical protein